MRKRRQYHRLEERSFASRLLNSVAFWQGMTFVMLVSLIWVNEVLDLAHLLYDRPASPIDWFGASILSAGIVLVGFVSVAHTYVQQQRALNGFLVVCSHCHKVRVGESDWTQLEQFVEGRTKTEFSHGICPGCYHATLEADTLPQEGRDFLNAPSTPAPSSPHPAAAEAQVPARSCR